MVLPHAVLLLIKLQSNNYQFNQRTKVVEVCYMRCSHDSHFCIENNLFCTFPHSRAEVEFLEDMALKLWLYVTEVVKKETS